MFAALAGMVDAFFKIKDITDLFLSQERLMMIISFLETMSGIHIQTAIEELRDAAQSIQPEKECNRAIGHLKLAANALIRTLDKTPMLDRFLRLTNYRKMYVYLQITGCYLLIAGLYLVQQNMILAQQYATEAAKAFEAYADLRRPELINEITHEFVGMNYTLQAVTYFIYALKWNELMDLKERYQVEDTNEVYPILAEERLTAMRERLFGYLAPLGELG